MLDEALIKQLVRENGCRFDIHTVEETGSTNDDLKKFAAERSACTDGYVLIADRQTSGRGRMGHSFFSPSSGVYLSVLLYPDTAPDETLHLTAAAGIAVCRAAEALTKLKAEIKWVNDIYINGRKVCGILTESSLIGQRTNWAVVGIGVNIEEPEGSFPDDIKNRACALFPAGNAPEYFRERFAAELLTCFERQINAPWKDTLTEYRSRSYLTGREVLLSDGCSAMVTDISDDGSLVVKLPDGEIRTIGSQFSIRET